MSQSILDRVLQSPRLPSLPAIALQVIDLVGRNDLNIKQIAQTISHDPALSGKILKTVNSSFYGRSQSIGTVSHALVILGLNSVKTLALGFSLLPHLRQAGGPGFDHVGFWKRSLCSAVAARALAKQAGMVVQEEAFLGGLLQDLGQLAMSQTLGPEYRQLVAKAGARHRQVLAMEQEALGIDHAQVGAALAREWKLPPALAEPIRCHEQPDLAPADLRPLAQCVFLGGTLGEVFVDPERVETLEHFRALSQEWMGLAAEQADSLLAEVHKTFGELRSLFDLPTGRLQEPDQILARANEALTQLSLEQQARTSELERQANTDSLTGVANRRRFGEVLNSQFEQVGSPRSPLSLLFLDTDHFKKFNDTYGHQTGDRVLAELAAALQAAAPSEALVARYGGEEFAIVLPETDRAAAAKLAEAIRLRVEQHAVAGDGGQPLRVTVSIGVATHDSTFFARAEQLVKAADQAVYAAKSAGRNCVRVFTPRPTPIAA